MRVNTGPRPDPLTGMDDRRLFLERVQRTLRHGRPLTVALIDLDDFKGINDRHGRAGGDRALRLTARAIREGVGEGGLAARLGGDEFAVLLPGAEPKPARRIMERIRESVRIAAETGGGPVVTLSIGMATFDPPPAAAEELVRRLDRVMSSVKRYGRNGILHVLLVPEGVVDDRPL